MRVSELLALPVELLTKILKNLSWRDVLHIRETCKLLCAVTRTRAIWAHLVQEHISSKEVPPRLERPIELYTSQELERCLVRWKSAEIGWGKDDGRAASERSFQCEPPGLTHLIQGGRWFLVTSPIGAVTYYDLEAETISGVELIPAHFPRDPWGTTEIYVAVEVDTTSPLLNFNMAISSAVRTSPIECHALYVWRVTAILDESGHVVGLSASRLAVLRHLRNLSALVDFSLRGPYAAFISHIGFEHSRDYVVVVRWDQGDNYPYRMRIVDVSENWIRAKILLLPKSRVLLIEQTHLRLWDFSAVEETTDFIADTDSIRRAVVWIRAFRFHGYLGRRSLVSVFCVENTVRVLVSGFHLYAFSISSLSREPPTVHKLFEYPEGRMEPLYAFGISHGVLYDNMERKFALMTYSFNPPSVSLIFKKFPSNTSQRFNLLAFDEESGRVVLNRRGRADTGYFLSYALVDRTLILYSKSDYSQPNCTDRPRSISNPPCGAE